MVLKRKIDSFLEEWHSNPQRLPLIVKGARQIGKTFSVMEFAKRHYSNIVYINFALQQKFHVIFRDGYEVENVIKNITYIDTSITFVPGDTLLFFDEIQACPKCATSLKSFALAREIDVICSGSLMGINYHEIESNSVGYKQDYEMFSLDFEEFLWAKGYTNDQICSLLDNMVSLSPLLTGQMESLTEAFREYMTLGGMPAIVNRFIETNTFSGSLESQRQLLADYEEDITKYAIGLDKGKILAAYRQIPVFLGQDNKKFQISKVSPGARSREYVGVIDWLKDAGIINVCYCLNQLSLPLRGNYNPTAYKVYFQDTGLLTASLDEEAQEDLRANRNFNTYKGALYENVMADMLRKQNYGLYYYKSDKSDMEIDFFVRDAHSLVPLEVKAEDHTPRSLVNLIKKADKYTDIKYGIKFGHKNIGFNGQFYTFPYFLAFLLRRYLKTKL